MLKISGGASSVKVHLLCFCWNSLSQSHLNSQPFLQVQNNLLLATRRVTENRSQIREAYGLTPISQQHNMTKKNKIHTSTGKIHVLQS